MVAVDTNLLVRIIVGDNRLEASRAAALMARNSSVYLTKTVLLELEWVLRRVYKIDQRLIEATIRDLLTIVNAEVEDEPAVNQALAWYGKGIDFGDALHLASVGPARQFATFDQPLIRQAQRLGIPNVVAV